MNLKELKQIVQLEVDATLDEGRVADKRVVAQDVVSANRGESDSDFAIACSLHAVQAIAGDLIRLVAKKEIEADSSQGILPGFVHVRNHYSVMRDNVSMIVPILQMTHDELLLKVTELRAHGYGALAHALELEKYATSIGAVARPIN